MSCDFIFRIKRGREQPSETIFSGRGSNIGNILARKGSFTIKEEIWGDKNVWIEFQKIDLSKED